MFERKNTKKSKDHFFRNYKNMHETSDQNYYYRRPKGIYRIGHDSIRLMIWMA